MKVRLRALLNRGVDYLQEKFPPNRLAVLLGPVFGAAAGAVVAATAKYLPGLPAFSTTELAGLFGLGFTAASTAVYKWIDGWQKHEAKLLDTISRDIAGALQKAPPAARRASAKLVAEELGPNPKD